MMKFYLIIFAGIFYYGLSIMENDEGCDIFTHRLTVRNGEFKDICGDITLTSNDTNLITSSDIIQIENGSRIWMSKGVQFQGIYTIIIEGYRLATPEPLMASILGPNSVNSNYPGIAYHSGYSDTGFVFRCYKSKGGLTSIFPLDEVNTEMSTIVLHNENGVFTIYQNGILVKTTYDDNIRFYTFRQIGGYFNYGQIYPSNVAIKNIMFVYDEPIATILNRLDGITVDQTQPPTNVPTDQLSYNPTQTPTTMPIKDTSTESACEWKLVYEHDINGEPIYGNSQDLINDIHNGKDIRIVGKCWGDCSFVITQPSRVWTKPNGRVYIFADDTISMGWDTNDDPFADQNMLYKTVFDTSGRIASYTNQNGEPGKIVLVSQPGKYGAKWFTRG
eukprot:450541_1